MQIGQSEGGVKQDETTLQAQFNEGELPNTDSANEFYDIAELPEIKRELDTWLQPMVFDPDAALPPPSNIKGMRP